MILCTQLIQNRCVQTSLSFGIGGDYFVVIVELLHTHRISLYWKTIPNPITTLGWQMLEFGERSAWFYSFSNTDDVRHTMFKNKCAQIVGFTHGYVTPPIWRFQKFYRLCLQKISLTCSVFPRLKWVHINHFSVELIEWRSQQVPTVPYCCSIEQTRKLYPPYWIGAKLFKRAFV